MESSKIRRGNLSRHGLIEQVGDRGEKNPTSNREGHYGAKKAEEKLKKSQEKLRNLNNELEQMVRERTKKLSSSKKKLRQQNIELKKLDKIKNDFITMLAHELKTPLISISGYIDYILTKQEDLDVEINEDLTIVQRNVRRLEDMMNQLLDVMKLDENKLELIKEPTNFKKLLNSVIKELDYQITNKNIRLKVDVEDKMIEVDPTRISHVLINLIYNAVKFTHEGYVEVRCRLSEEIITVEVEDTGIGMEEDFVDQLFQAFRQESSGLSRQFEGSGLGLTITRHLLELVGGRIDVDSHKGEGSTFTVEIPRDWRDTAEQGGGFATPDPVVQEPLPAGQHVLVVDDDPAAAELITEMLPDTHAVDAAAAPDDALSLTAGQEYDLIFMDINLKARINGAELLEEMRGADVVGGATVVALTAYALPGDREKYLAKGFDGYLAKPFNRMILFDHLARLLD